MEGDDAELLRHPTRIGCYGASGSGKTVLTLELLKDPRMKFDRVIWVCPEYSTKQSQIAKLGEKGFIGKGKGKKPFLLIPATEGWQQRFEEAVKEGEDAGEKGKPLRQCVVLDDLIGHTAGSEGKIFSELFTGGRHRGLTTIELLQRVFPNSASRTHRINCEHHICFRLGAKDEAKTLFRQAAPEDYKKLAAAYEKVVSENPHGFVWIDQTYHKKHPELRYRAGLEDVILLDD